MKALMCANNWLTTVSFLWRLKLSTLWCCVIHPKKPVWRLTVCQSCQIYFLREKKKRKKSCSPTEPPHNFVIYSIFIFSLNVKQDLRKLGVVQGFGTNEINGLHPTFHNIIKSEIFWRQNLLLKYKVSLIVLPPSSLTLLQSSKQAFMS